MANDYNEETGEALDNLPPRQPEMRWRPMESDKLDLLTNALVKAQAAMKPAIMNKINPHFKSKYADLAAVIEAIREPLSDNSLAFTQTMRRFPEGFFLITTLLHTSGQWLRSEYPLPANATPQGMGSNITYARRYSLLAITGTAVNEDDDANEAQAKPEKPEPIKPAKAKPKHTPPESGPQPTHQQAHDKQVPHEVPRPAGIKPVEWGGVYVGHLKACDTLAEMEEWATANAQALKDLEKMAPGVWERIAGVEKDQRETLTQEGT